MTTGIIAVRQVMLDTPEEQLGKRNRGEARYVGVRSSVLGGFGFFLFGE